jgi:hypothetical protein
LKNVVDSGITEVAGDWKLKVNLEKPFSMEYMNTMAVTSQYAITATVCSATLKDEAVNQIINVINFEEIKARAIVIILRNEAMGGT